MILVTGSTGFIGRSLMHGLEREGRPVKVFAGRINQRFDLRSELPGAEVVIHLAGVEAHNRPRMLRYVDVDGTRRLLDESVRAGVRHIILVSRLNADANSLYPLLRAKGEQERLVRSSEIPHTILRSATLFGRDDRFLNVIAALAAWSWPFVWLPGDGQVASQPLWVEDLVRCLLACLDSEALINQTVEIAGDERLRYDAIVREVLRTAGLRRKPIRLPVKLVRPLAMLFFGWWRRPPVTRFFMDRFTMPEVAPVDSVLRTFGFQPARMGQHMAYLRRSALWWRLFQSR